MLLTLEMATLEKSLENVSYTWQFPSMKFNMCIQTYDVGIPVSYSFMFNDTSHQVSQIIVPPKFNSFSFDFESDYFTIFFVKDPTNKATQLTPSELSIELTPI